MSVNDADISQRVFERGMEEARLAGMRAAWGFYPEVPKVAPPEPTHCTACGQRLRKKPRADFHGLRVVK